METNWYPEGRVPFAVLDAFVGARTYAIDDQPVGQH
jgi:hypothetical protein